MSAADDPRGDSAADSSSEPLGDISLGDVIRAWRELGATDTPTRQFIAEVLGFEYEEKRAAEGAGPSEPAQPVVAAPMPQPGEVGFDVPDQPEAPPPAALAAAVNVPLGVVGRHETTSADPDPDWRIAPEPLEPEHPGHVAFRPPRVPLLDDRWTPSIVAAACATFVNDGPFDFEALVEQVARLQPLADIPRREVRTLRRGVQLLVDHGDAMMPFTRDVSDLIAQISEVAGRDRTELRHFVDCPIRGAGSGARSTWRKPYTPPAAGTPVVVVSDLGIMRPALTRGGARADEWLAFASRVRSAGCPLLAIVPFPPSRWPEALSGTMRILFWDRSTTVSLARRVLAGEKPR